MSEERMRRIARAAMELQPDLAVLTGDLLDVSPLAAKPFSRAFGELRGKLGTFAILGNHDYFAGFPAVERAVLDAGATLLRNSGARIEKGRGSLFIGGVDDPSWASQGVDAPRAFRAAAPEEPRIMLAHRPSLFEECAAQGAQLVLSGHTHGGQFALSPQWSLARVLGPYTMGLYQRGDARLYVHRGMGTVGPVPVRLGSPPEIALITLRAV
jgi:predicted MPP superfamily phosphohydrolase